MDENAASREIVDASLQVHKALGPGLLESVYTATLAKALRSRGLKVATEVGMPVDFEGSHFELGFRADLIVEDCVIVEVKSVTDLLPVHQKQLLTYLRLGNKKLGLLINFNVALIKNGICRIANGI
ncbi:MAG: GxxExxY protein [Bryobacteraceae bacterium]